MDSGRRRRPAADAAGDQGAADEDAELFWERHCRTRRAWGARVNPLLAETAAPLRPGAALDLGCGAGGDAIWLAQGRQPPGSRHRRLTSRVASMAGAADLAGRVAPFTFAPAGDDWWSRRVCHSVPHSASGNVLFSPVLRRLGGRRDLNSG
ncbi:hypothetical protein [Streptomyces atratus]|uniref:hypothetical protein n=1 Tax=Streptomyces atratus TaxID=1893 RepID=UPI00225A2351|nr:hypothetical protein [Streptomyces atratus]MCX5338654.1 hypothetical protein [Streptomyces atratus]